MTGSINLSKIHAERGDILILRVTRDTLALDAIATAKIIRELTKALVVILPEGWDLEPAPVETIRNMRDQLSALIAEKEARGSAA